MNEIVIANLLFQAAAATVLMLVAGVSAARQLHDRRSFPSREAAPQDSCTVVELPASRAARVAPDAQRETHSKAA